MKANALTVFLAIVLSVSNAHAQTERVSTNELILENGVAPNAKIDNIYRRFSEAYKKLEPLAVTDLYTEDAFYLSPGSEITRGREKIRANFEEFFRSVRENGGSLSISFRILDRRVSGDLAYDVGIYTLTQKRLNSEARTSTGKFVVVIRRMQNREWRFHVDSFSDLPNKP